MRQVSGACLEKDGKIFIARRKTGDNLAGKWEFPGGKLEPGETPEACLKRELKEEFGVETRIGEFICASKFEYKHLPIELLVYRAYHVAGEFQLRDHDQLAWVTLAELKAYEFCGADIPVVEHLLRGK